MFGARGIGSDPHVKAEVVSEEAHEPGVAQTEMAMSGQRDGWNRAIVVGSGEIQGRPPTGLLFRRGQLPGATVEESETAISRNATGRNVGTIEHLARERTHRVPPDLQYPTDFLHEPLPFHELRGPYA
jgi:hypothetical protein